MVRLAGAPVTWEQRVLAACLSAGPGAAASHRAAALLWGFRGIETGARGDHRPAQPTAEAGRRGSSSLAGGRPGSRIVASRSRRRPRPCSCWGRWSMTLTLESAVEDAILQAADVGRVGWRPCSSSSAVPGSDGTAALRRVLEERGAGAAATESVLEDKMVRLLRRAGMEEFERQYRVAGVRARLRQARHQARHRGERDGVPFGGGRRAAQLPEAQPAARARVADPAVHLRPTSGIGRDDMVGELDVAMAA